jgi:hypothetical protein
MKRSDQTWRVALAGLMVLAVILVWPPLGSDAASSADHVAITALHSHDAHAQDVDCQPSAVGCCMMTHCHPGMSFDAHEMTTVVARSETTVAPPVRGLGNNPGVILPPPRRSWL